MVDVDTYSIRNKITRKMNRKDEQNSIKLGSNEINELGIRELNLADSRIFLIVFYCFLGKSLREVSLITQCSKSKIYRRLNEFNLPVRAWRAAHHDNELKLFKNKLFLIVFYNFLQLSARKVGAIAGCDHKLILTSLRYHKLPIRSRSQAQIVRAIKEIPKKSKPFTPRFREQIIGSLLADGSLLRRTHSASLKIGMSIKSKEYILKLPAKHAVDSGYTIGTRSYKDKNGKEFFELLVHASLEFLELFNKWYRRPTKEELKEKPDRKWVKKLPYDFYSNDLTPYACSIWLIEDGSWNRGRGAQIRLCLHNFTKEENNRLAGYLKEVLDPSGLEIPNDDLGVLKTYRKIKNKTYYYIRLKAIAKERFLQYVGESPVKCFDYKFVLS